MADETSQSFAFPGGDPASDFAGNPLLASLEMMRQAWSGLTGPGGLASLVSAAVPKDLPELERRLSDLRMVENWLRLNLSSVTGVIQALEVQRTTMVTLQGMAEQARDAMGGAVPPGNGFFDALSGNAAASGGQASEAAQMWWTLMQQQFNQLAAAAASTIATPGATGAPAPAWSAPGAGVSAGAAQPAPTAGAAPKKTAATASGSTARRSASSKAAAAVAGEASPRKARAGKTQAGKSAKDKPA